MLSARVAVLEPAVAVAASFAQTRTGEIEESRDDKALRSHSEAQARSSADVIKSARTQKEMSMEMVMRIFTRFGRYLAPGVLVACVVLLGAPCAAQEVDVPGGHGSGSVVAPSGWAEVITPVQQRVDLKFYGFFIGELNAPSAQVDATFRATKFLSITPSYLYYSIPAGGLNELANVSRGFSSSLQEHQFRIDGTVMFSIHKFEISDRNMYVRRFLQTNDINRYRNRVSVAHPLRVKDQIWKPFASYEAFYDQGSGWTKDRVWTGVTVPIAKQVSFQPSYMWEGSKGIKDLHYLMFGLIFRTSSGSR